MKEGWKEVEFFEIVDFPPRIKMEKEKLYPFVLMDEIDAGYKYVKASFFKKYNGSGAKFENGDTLFARITPSLENGKIAQIKDIGKPAFGSTEFFVFRGKKGVSDSDFIYYLAKTDWFRQNAINSFVGASGRQRADAKYIGKTKVHLPPLPTQRRIATILSAYDDLIENNLRRIKLLEKMAQNTYEEWFVRMKFPGHENTKFDKETGLPEGWKKVKLENLCAKITDGTHDSPKQTEAGYKLITGKHILDGFIHFETAYTISREDHNAIKRRSGLEKGDILFSNIGTLGNVAMVVQDFEFSCKNVIIFKKKNGFSNFLYTYLTSSYTKEKLETQSSGVAQKFYSLKFVRNLKDYFPTEQLIKYFDEYAGVLYKQKNNLYNQNQRLKEARDILLPRLMSGMIEV